MCVCVSVWAGKGCLPYTRFLSSHSLELVAYVYLSYLCSYSVVGPSCSQLRAAYLQSTVAMDTGPRRAVLMSQLKKISRVHSDITMASVLSQLEAKEGPAVATVTVYEEW